LKVNLKAKFYAAPSSSRLAFISFSFIVATMLELSYYIINAIYFIMPLINNTQETYNVYFMGGMMLCYQDTGIAM